MCVYSWSPRQLVAENLTQASYSMPMREGLRGDFLCLRKVQRASGSVEVSWCDYAYWLFRLFSRHISRTQSFQENRHFKFQVFIVLKTLVSLIGRLQPCSARIAAYRQTDKHTHRPSTVTIGAHARRGLKSSRGSDASMSDFTP